MNRNDVVTGVLGGALAGAPAQVGARAASVVGADIPPRHAGTTTNVVHWATGVGWGVAGAMLGTSETVPPVLAGLAAGAAAFGGAYTVLPILGIYDPIWEYDGKTLWKDATAHATYGAATGIALGVVQRVVPARC